MACLLSLYETTSGFRALTLKSDRMQAGMAACGVPLWHVAAGLELHRTRPIRRYVDTTTRWDARYLTGMSMRSWNIGEPAWNDRIDFRNEVFLTNAGCATLFWAFQDCKSKWSVGIWWCGFSSMPLACVTRAIPHLMTIPHLMIFDMCIPVFLQFYGLLQAIGTGNGSRNQGASAECLTDSPICLPFNRRPSQ